MNGKTPLLLTLLLAALMLAGITILQPYSAISPWNAYTKPARHFLQAALRGDSLALARQSGSAGAVSWALDVARHHRDSLAVWASEATASSGGRRGDTADVLLETPTAVCSEHPIWLRFVGSGDGLKVLQASSTCFGPR